MTRRSKRLAPWLATLGLLACTGLVIAICANPAFGPDVTVAILIDMDHYTTGGPINGMRAYAIGTESLNRGNADVHWFANSNLHPVIAQNLYRWKQDVDRPAGRFEQVGMSWLKHGFTALAGTEFCTSCTFEAGHSSGLWLGMGCQDPYWAGLNGSQSNLGPRSEVNATSGVFTYPYVLQGTGDATLKKRLLTLDSDILDNTADQSALRYFAEGQYIAQDDAQAGNGLNNATFREVLFDSGKNPSWGGGLGGYPGQQLQEAIRAWKRIDGDVEISRVDYEENFLPARFNLGARSRDNGDGTWRYEYALHNLNSHRSAQAFTVPIPPGAQVTGAGFHAVDHHSGEPYSTTDWTVTIDTVGGTVTWATETFGANPNANALRWGTLFNFWMDVNEPPGSGDASIVLFRSGGAGEPASLAAATILPGASCLYCDGFETGDDLRWSGAF